MGQILAPKCIFIGNARSRDPIVKTSLFGEFSATGVSAADLRKLCGDFQFGFRTKTAYFVSEMSSIW
jgi:hypothetical protein